MPLITEEEIVLVYETFPELREQTEEGMAAQAEDMEVGAERSTAPYETNDYGVPYRSPEPFWVGPGSSEDESMPDSNQENQPPQDPNSPVPHLQNDSGTYEVQQIGLYGIPPEREQYESHSEYLPFVQYEELDGEGIRNLATMLGVTDVDRFKRFAQSLQVFRAVSTLVRERFLHQPANYLDFAGWHLARRIFLVGSHNAAEVGVSTGGLLLPHEWTAFGVVDLFEAMDEQRREMGIEPWGGASSSKSFEWRVYYGILVLYLNSTADMAYALLIDDDQGWNETEENEDWIEAVTGAVNAFAETLCEDGEYDPTAAGSYPRGTGR